MQVTISTKRNRVVKYLVGAAIIMAALYKGADIMWGEDYLTFFKGIIRNPMQVGAMTPCSRFVCKEVTKHIAAISPEKPLRILEVGGGSGVFTRQLENLLQAREGDYHVDVIEIDPEYAAVLQNRFGNNKHFTIHCTNILDFNTDTPYDYIVSSIPFSTIDEQLVSAILNKYTQLALTDAGLSYVEHIWLPDIKQFFLRGKEKEEFIARRARLKEFKERYLIETVKVYSNITPLYVYHLKIK